MRAENDEEIEIDILLSRHVAIPVIASYLAKFSSLSIRLRA